MKKSNRKPNKGHRYQQPRARNLGYRLVDTKDGPVWTNQHPFIAPEDRSGRSIRKELTTKAAMLIAAEFQRLSIAKREEAAKDGKKVKWRLEEGAALKLLRTAQENVNKGLEALGKTMTDALTAQAIPATV